jgi:O-glycosyl hydrolase
MENLIVYNNADQGVNVFEISVIGQIDRKPTYVGFKCTMKNKEEVWFFYNYTESPDTDMNVLIADVERARDHLARLINRNRPVVKLLKY